MLKYLLIAAVLLVFGCSKDFETIYKPDPDDEAVSTAPLITVIYDADALGDNSYNDLIYEGVERTAMELGLRTMQQSPQTYEQGLQYLELMFRQMETAKDSVRRLFIVTSPGYDDFIRKNNNRLEANPNADPTTGFEKSYEVKFGTKPTFAECKFYDALMLAAFAASYIEHSEAGNNGLFNDAVVAITTPQERQLSGAAWSAMSSAGTYEQSFADNWSSELGVWRCDRFTHNLVTHLTGNPASTYRDLYLYCARHTLGSHVHIVNSANFGNLYTTGPQEFFTQTR